MTREELIEFGNMWLQINEDRKDSIKYAFFQMAVTALSQEPQFYPPCEDCNKKMDEIRRVYDKCKKQELCEDTISIDNVIEWLKNKDIIKLSTQEEIARKELRDLPSVSTENTGQWEKAHDGYSYWYKCSRCGEKIPKNYFGSDYFSPYCPECGAKMEVEE